MDIYSEFHCCLEYFYHLCGGKFVGLHKRSVAGATPGTAKPYPGLRPVGAVLTANSPRSDVMFATKVAPTTKQ